MIHLVNWIFFTDILLWGEFFAKVSLNKDLPTRELVKRLFDLFPTIGYGDSQYIELINKTR